VRDTLIGRRGVGLLLCRLLLCRLRLGLRSMVPDDTSGCSADDGMMSCDMPCDGTHRRAFHTALSESHPGPSAQANGGHQHTHDENSTHPLKDTTRT